MKSYKDLLVWQKSIKLVEITYRITTLFPPSELYGLVSQMRRSAISIPSNVAEGQQRKSRKEFVRFLSIAYGSSAELETQMVIAKIFYPSKDYDILESELIEVQKMLNVLISRLGN